MRYEVRVYMYDMLCVCMYAAYMHVQHALAQTAMHTA